MSHYETKTRPALRNLSRAAHEGYEGDPMTVKKAVDAAAAAGATKNEIIAAVGGHTAWNALVRQIKARARQRARKH